MPHPLPSSLVFTEPVNPELVTVVVTSTAGTQWQAGAPVVSAANVSQPLQPLTEAGEYVVAYRVVSADGHPVTGQVGFVLRLPAFAPTEPSATALPTSTRSPLARSRHPRRTPRAVPPGRTLRSGSLSQRCCSPSAWGSPDHEPDPEEARGPMAVDRESRAAMSVEAPVEVPASTLPPGTVLALSISAGVAVLLLGLWAGNALTRGHPGTAQRRPIHPVGTAHRQVRVRPEALATVGALVAAVALVPSAGADVTATGIRCLRAAAVWAACGLRAHWSRSYSRWRTSSASRHRRFSTATP